MAKDIVFLKSLALTPTQWYLQKKFFKNKNYRVHTVDYIESNDMDKIVADVEEQIKNIQRKNNITQINLVGLSMGGMVAQRIAADHPDWINKLVFTGTYHKMKLPGKIVMSGLKKVVGNVEEKELMSYEKMLKMAPFFGFLIGHKADLIEHIGKKWVVNSKGRLVHKIVRKQINVADAHRYELEKAIKEQGAKSLIDKIGKDEFNKMNKAERKKRIITEGRKAIADHIEAIIKYTSGGDAKKDFKKIKKNKKLREKIMIMAGWGEIPITVKALQMKMALPKARFTIINTGHLSNLEKPQLFNESIQSFFEGRKAKLGLRPIKNIKRTFKLIGRKITGRRRHV